MDSLQPLPNVLLDMNGFVPHSILILVPKSASDVQFDTSKSLRHRSGAWFSLCWWTCVLPSLSVYAVVRTDGNNLESYTLDPLEPYYIYIGPTKENQDSCRCSSVYYSLLSGCAHCQGRENLRWILLQTISLSITHYPCFSSRWSIYSANCTTVYIGVWAFDHLSFRLC
jgi:hypothetical protein